MADEQPKIEQPVEQKAEIVPKSTAISKELTEVEAFQLYLSLGTERSHQKVLDKWRESVGEVSVSLRTIERWSAENKWVEKADEFDKKKHDELFRQALKGAVRSKVDILTICQAVLGRFAVDLKGEQITIRRKDKAGNQIEEIKMNRYHPTMFDVERAYRIIKEEIGEGLPEFGAIKELNLTAVFQQIFKNAESTKQRGESGIVDSGATP